MPVPGPRTPSRANDDGASRPGSEPRAQYRQALELNHRPAAPPRRKLQPPLPPPPGSQQVPQQQPLSASAPIAAAAASEPKRNKKPQKTGKCSEHTCRPPDCRCIGTDIPGSLPVNETPQMVMLTFDDSVNVANYDYFTQLFDGKFRNPNGCPIRGTFFVSGDATQYHFVEKLHKQGQEIASHSVTHRSPTTYWAHAGYDGYVEEIEGMRKKLAEASNIPRESIRGMRVPFLQVGGDDQYQMLEDFGFTYDTSMVTGHLYKDSNPPIWPFTLDYPPDSKTCSLTPCPTKSYPGLWEVPLIRWYGTNRLACAMPDGCTIGGGRVGTLQFLQDNFRRHYDTNRAPFGIFLHASWFRRKEGNLEGLMDFLQEMSQMKDVWVISVSQVIDWMRSPETNSRAGKLDSWTC
ncbi:uncharacterized protein LOC112572559 isoform X1 [Pomacea canaliculata]|uniref:uncharacterized protein LOC112572559 isoform X1 n=1 Tax=Pomacea canaliculata TaxID=400727 RepID=UPI000D72C8D5|nr:uncharacterized protein LOC112572559 isoform X1 [Pomacea canaliculata]